MDPIQRPTSKEPSRKAIETTRQRNYQTLRAKKWQKNGLVRVIFWDNNILINIAYIAYMSMYLERYIAYVYYNDILHI